MTKDRHDPIASLLADGEAAPEQRSRLSDPSVRAEVAEIRRLSAVLQVPATDVVWLLPPPSQLISRRPLSRDPSLPLLGSPRAARNASTMP